MKQHYKIQVNGDYQRLERKLQKYLSRKSEARTRVEEKEFITLRNGSTMILGKENDSLEILVATTEGYLQKAVNTLLKYVKPEQIGYQLV
jgi:hypothetical protein